MNMHTTCLQNCILSYVYGSKTRVPLAALSAAAPALNGLIGPGISNGSRFDGLWALRTFLAIELGGCMLTMGCTAGCWGVCHCPELSELAISQGRFGFRTAARQRVAEQHKHAGLQRAAHP